jgi:hypothetical protein
MRSQQYPDRVAEDHERSLSRSFPPPLGQVLSAMAAPRGGAAASRVIAANGIAPLQKVRNDVSFLWV